MSKKSNELNFLKILEEGKEVTQKNLSLNISVSIGFINALIKKFLNKGIIKIKQAPYKRFIYYLTPAGFSEKAKLVNEYFNDSLSFFKILRSEFNYLFSNENCNAFYFYGTGEVCEIGVLSAQENNKKIIRIIEPKKKKKKFLNYKVSNEIPKSLGNKKIVITSKTNQQDIYFKLLKKFNANQILFIKSMFISRKIPNYKPTKRQGIKNG